MKDRSVWVAWLVALGFVLVGLGCDASSLSGTGEGASAAAGASGPNGGGGAGAAGGCFLCGGSNPGGGPPAGTIVISPQDALLQVSDGNVPTQSFTATLDGQDVTSVVTWVYDHPNVGTMTANVFTPTALAGGPGTLTALYSSSEGSTTVTVAVTHVVNPGNVDPTPFDNPVGPDPSLNLIYPFDGTVMPLRVASPEFQWNGGAGGDVYRLKLTSKYMAYTEYFNAPAAPMFKVLDQTTWENIEYSGTGPVSDPLKVELARKQGASAYQPKVVNLGIAQGFVHGAVYYWQLPDMCGGNENGQILRIRADSPQTEQFYNTTDCWGCHSVSRDGRRLFSSWSTTYPFPLQEIDLTTNPATLGPITAANMLTGTFSAYNADGTRVLFSDNFSGGPDELATRLHVVDSTTGQYVLQGALGPACGEGAWSPDGTMLAAICGMSGGWGWTFDSTTGYIQVAQITPNGDAITSQATIVQQGALAGRPAYPSFSPESKFIAYGRPDQGSRSTGNGTLWVVGTDGSNPRELYAAEHSDTRNFSPVYAPKGAGGYNWVVFMSRRDYGNQLVGANRQQLWMYAIDDPPDAADPSHPPFYMRGQQNCGKSESAYYALDPCKDIGQDCTTGIECCNGQCVYDAQQHKTVCGTPPDPGDCVQDGNACVLDTDCCNYPTVTCYQGFCQPKPPR